MDFYIRNIRGEDKEQISKLIELVNQEDRLGYSLTHEWLDHIVESASEGVFLGFYKENLVGLASAMINAIYEDQSALNIVVAPEFRNMGLGTSLYDKIYGFIGRRNIKIAETFVKERLGHGVSFAKKRGFKTTMYSWEMEIDLRNRDFKLDRYDLKLRKASEADNLIYRNLIYNGFQDDLGESGLGETLKDPSIIVYILENKGEAIGSATVQMRPELSMAYIYDIVILESYRGRGFGSCLIKSFLGDLQKKNIKKASLMVTESNETALGLYKKLGFKELDVDLIMAKNI